MNYFLARKYRKTIKTFESVTDRYWAALPEQRRSYVADRFVYRENEESSAIRNEVSRLLPYIEEAAQRLGVNHIIQSYPAPAVGGPILPVNIFKSVIEPEIGHSILERRIIVDTLVRAKSIARKKEKDALWSMCMPWNWLIEGCVLLLRFPFIVLRRAGVPAKVEESLWANIIKIIGGIGICGFLFYRGVVSSDEIMRYLKEMIFG